MDSTQRAKVKHSTQEHLDVRDIFDDLVITKTNTVCIVIETNAVNFDLLSEQEQMNKISSFSGLLNSLNFPVQILITTKRIDITNYLNFLKSKERDTMTDELKEQLKIYRMFVKNLIVQNDVLDKRFYVVIAHYGTGTITDPLQIVKAQKNTSLYNKKNLITKAKSQLYFKRDHLLKQLGRMGLNGNQLSTAQLIDLFHDVYNPEE